MFNIHLKNGKSFFCDANSTIFEAAKSNGIILEHSCLKARCRSCAVQIQTGSTKDKHDDLVLSIQEKANNWTLSCNSIPTSNLILDIEDLGGIQIFEKKIIPAKINSIEKLNDTVVEVSLRLPPNSNFAYNAGQYVNISRGEIKRSYSIANTFKENGILTFFIKKYDGGLMSNYWFEDAKVNDLLRIEGALGSFFLRQTDFENIIFLATGTGIAPFKAILENLSEVGSASSKKNISLYFGARYEKDIFWNPYDIDSQINLNFIPVLSRPSDEWSGERGYIQDILIKQNLDLSKAQVYACGSEMMIEAARKILLESGLKENNFFADAFVPTN
jgi:CDP-4-dehydro-6-deoxyglucose reductase